MAQLQKRIGAVYPVQSNAILEIFRIFLGSLKTEAVSVFLIQPFSNSPLPIKTGKNCLFIIPF